MYTILRRAVPRRDLARGGRARRCDEFNRRADAASLRGDVSVRFEARVEAARETSDRPRASDDDSRARRSGLTMSLAKLLALLALARASVAPRAAPVKPIDVPSETVEFRPSAEGALRRCRERCRSDSYGPSCALGVGTLANECWAVCAAREGALDGVGRPTPVVDGACAPGASDRWRAPSWTCAGACVALYAPVCGENGMTYSNSCVAACSGVKNFIAGTCHDAR